MTADEIKQATPIEPFLIQKGVQLRGSGTVKTTNRCPLKEHKPDHQCVTVNVSENWWNCNDCGTDGHKVGGTVIDWQMMEKGMGLSDVLKAFDQPKAPYVKPREVAWYSYRNELGAVLFQCVRMQPKDFKQRRPDGKGGWIYNLDGVRRVLYNLPEILKENSGPIVVVEGEKDTETLKLINVTATTNVCGGGQWKDGYTDFLKGKDVVLCGDNDKKGAEHVRKVASSMAGKVKTLRIVTVPEPHKDISDFLAPCKTQEEARDEWDKLFAAAAVIPNGVNLPILSMEDMELAYRGQLKRCRQTTLDFTRWLPSLARHLRGIVPGEIITFLAGTGVGKTAWASNLAMHAAPLPVLFFEMELPAPLLFERLAACDEEIPCSEIEKEYSNCAPGNWRKNNRLSHIYVVPEPNMNPENLASLINKAELKMGVRPAIIIVDYLQLMGGEGKTRYERASFVAEQLKITAKATNTIIVCVSQISRQPTDKDGHRRLAVTLESGKDSGSIENSSGLVIGAWRPDEKTIRLCILKNTKGRSNITIDCNFNGETMVINEKSKIDESDVPAKTQRDSEIEANSRNLLPYADS